MNLTRWPTRLFKRFRSSEADRAAERQRNYAQLAETMRQLQAALRAYPVVTPEIQARHEQADALARALLYEHLTPEQLAEADSGEITVRGSAGGTYKLGIDQNHWPVTTHSLLGITHYCAVPNYGLSRIPIADSALARKLLIETNEREFRRIAKSSRLT